ncbi:solute carrier family 22 member 8-like [Varroa destructor]|uniref:Major facilitator superfamily (MFS) profile domain-containing protein n=1 Tax=Varroa destructor TaxID=109461 RepID=A0A7M7JI53_VARDE|nr:solute carrier family 22 member 8-like [Varroa destructor]
MAEIMLDVSTVVGSFGRYQFVVMLLTVLRAFPTSWTLTSIDFLAGDVDHWCSPPTVLQEGEVENNLQFWKENGIPRINGKLSRCQRYVIVENTIWPNITEECDRWEYNMSAPSSSVVEWDLVCKRDWMRSAMQSVSFVGQFIGALFIGQLSDWYGRRFMLLVSTASVFIFGTVAAWSTSVHVFNGFRFLQAMAVSGLQTTTATLYTEICLPRDRNLLNIGFSLGFTLPMILLPLLAMALNNWRWVQISVGLSTILMLPCLIFIQESPRWLLAKGRLSEAKTALTRIFRQNGRECPDLEELTPALIAKAQADAASKNLTLSDIWSHRRLRNNLLMLLIYWFFENTFYFANAFLSTKLGGGRFMSFALSAAAEIPGGILSIFLIRYSHRRTSLAITLLLAGIASFILAFTPTDMVFIRLGLNMTCRFLLVMSTAIKWIYTFELLPTPARVFGFACCFCCGRIGGMIAPFMRDLANWRASAPHLILTAFSLGATATLNFIPETLNHDLPDSFAESNAISKKLKNTK